MSVTENELIKKAVAPRVTLAYLESQIASEHYFTAWEGALGHNIVGHDVTAQPRIPEALSLLTFCVLVMKNGFTAKGFSACASMENYNADIGQRLARSDAINSIWPLLGYELRSKLALVEAGTQRSFPEQKTSVGTKVVHAVRMTRGAYCELRGWKVPENENFADDGYLVEYADGGEPNVRGFVGYVSWSPKAVYEAAYHEVGAA